uniref:Uncharacterized protein n=1 Tax=Trichogramma kaykai TaxID=54128 RepID=A0ABD2VXQ3_9HYME
MNLLDQKRVALVIRRQHQQQHQATARATVVTTSGVTFSPRLSFILVLVQRPQLPLLLPPHLYIYARECTRVLQLYAAQESVNDSQSELLRNFASERQRSRRLSLLSLS